MYDYTTTECQYTLVRYFITAASRSLRAAGAAWGAERSSAQPGCPKYKWHGNPAGFSNLVQYPAGLPLIKYKTNDIRQFIKHQSL